jgi:hypothetical protein
MLGPHPPSAVYGGDGGGESKPGGGGGGIGPPDVTGGRELSGGAPDVNGGTELSGGSLTGGGARKEGAESVIPASLAASSLPCPPRAPSTTSPLLPPHADPYPNATSPNSHRVDALFGIRASLIRSETPDPFTQSIVPDSRVLLPDGRVLLDPSASRGSARFQALERSTGGHAPAILGLWRRSLPCAV